MIRNYIRKYKYSYLIGMLILLAVDYLGLYIPQFTGEVTDGLLGGMGMKEVLRMIGRAMVFIILPFALFCNVFFYNFKHRSSFTRGNPQAFPAWLPGRGAWKRQSSSASRSIRWWTRSQRSRRH